MTTTTFIIELVGIFGFLTNVWANILLARKAESGWIIRLGANVLWLAYGLVIFSLANILSSVVFAVINVYGWRRWRRERLAGSPPCPECAARAAPVWGRVAKVSGERALTIPEGGSEDGMRLATTRLISTAQLVRDETYLTMALTPDGFVVADDRMPKSDPDFNDELIRRAIPGLFAKPEPFSVTGEINEPDDE